MRSYLLLLLTSLASSTAMAAQDLFTVADYMQHQPGDTLLFTNEAPGGASTILLAWPTVETFQNYDVLKRTHSDGSWQYQTVDDISGYIVYQLYLQGDREIIFERPVTLLPTVVRKGAFYMDKTPYLHFLNGEQQGKGVQSYEVDIHGISSTDTPLKTFADCLVVSSAAEQTDESSGHITGYQYKRWYARGVGLVKFAGKVYEIDGQGKILYNRQVAAQLEAARIQGLWINGRTPAQRMRQ